MHRFVLLLALICAMFSVMAKGDVPRHNYVHSRSHDVKLRPTHPVASARRSSARIKAAKQGNAKSTSARVSTSHSRHHPAVARTGLACRHGRRCVSSREAALTPVHRTPRATLPTVPLKRVNFALPPMKGSHESLVRQNVRAEQDGLTRIQDDAELTSMLRSKQLVSLPVNNGLTIDSRLPANRRYCRQWTANFLADMARVHYGRFSAPLQVNSAVRTVEYQRHLQGINGNAAPSQGDNASPHLTGATIDIGKKGWSTSQIGWMRAYLLPLQSTGRIDVEEEFQQACFHITVYRSYSNWPQPGTAPSSGAAAAMLAARVR